MSRKLQKHSEVEIEKGLDDLARYLDGLFKVPGTDWRFGLDALIGLVPNIGDTLTLLPALYILVSGVRYGVPKITLLRMAMNLGLDYVVGSIPLIGDAFDFVWKANQRNMELIRTRARGRGEGTAGDYAFIFVLIGLLLIILIGSIVVSGLILYYVISGRPWV